MFSPPSARIIRLQEATKVPPSGSFRRCTCFDASITCSALPIRRITSASIWPLVPVLPSTCNCVSESDIVVCGPSLSLPSVNFRNSPRKKSGADGGVDRDPGGRRPVGARDLAGRLSVRAPPPAPPARGGAASFPVTAPDAAAAQMDETVFSRTRGCTSAWLMTVVCARKRSTMERT